MGLTERQALALALAESRRAALAAQPPPQDSDSDEEASDSGACRAKVAPAPRRPPPAKAAGGSDDESAAGPKPGDKVRRRVGDAGRSAGAAKRRRVGADAVLREPPDAGCGVDPRKAVAAVSLAAVELGKASTSSDNSKASRTTSTKLPAAARLAEALLASPDVKPCAPASEASKADSDGSAGGGRGEGGSGLGSGLGCDSDGEGRSARSSRDVVRPAGGRGSRGEGEGDSSERGGRRVSESAEGGAGAADAAGEEDALGPDATSVRAQRLAVRQAQQFQAARSPRAAAGAGPNPSPGQRAKEAGTQGAAKCGVPRSASAAELARGKPSLGQRANSEGRPGSAGKGGGRASSPKPAPYVAELVEADLFSLLPAKALPAAKDRAPGGMGRGAVDAMLKIRVCAGAGAAAELAEAAMPEPGAAPGAEDSPAARSLGAAPRKQPRKRGAGGAGRERAPKCPRARPRRAERHDDDPDYEGEDDAAGALLCREPGVLEEGGPATPAVKPEWANPFEAAAEGAGWADGAKAASPSPDPGAKQARARPPTRAARSATRSRPSGRWASGPLGGPAGPPVPAKFGAPASERRLRSAAAEDAALELEAGIFWRPPPAKKSARASPVLAACALLRACDEEQAPPAADGPALAQAASVGPALAQSPAAAALPGFAPGFSAGFAGAPAPPSPFLQASRLAPGGPSREGSLGSGEGTPQRDALQTPPPSPPRGATAQRAASLTFCTPADEHKNAHTPTLTPMRAPALPPAAALDLAGTAAALLQGVHSTAGTPAGTPAATTAATPAAAGPLLGAAGLALFSGRAGSASPHPSLVPASPVAAAALATCAALRERHDSEGLRLQRSAALDADDEGAEGGPRQTISLHSALSLPGSRLGKALAGGSAAAGGGDGAARQGSLALEAGLGSGFRRACGVLRAPLERAASPAWSSGGFGAAPRSRGPAGGLRAVASAQHLQQARSQRLLESTWDDLLARQAAEAQAAEAFAAWLAPAAPRSPPASPVAQGP